MPQDLMGKALAARRAVMDLCQAVEQNGRHGSPQTTSVDDRIAVRDQLIHDLMEALGDAVSALTTPYRDDMDLAEVAAKGRHVLDNVRDAMPKAGE